MSDPRSTPSKRSRDDGAVPEADALEQARDWEDEDEPESRRPRIPSDVPEADALDQERPVPLDDDYR